MSDPKTTITADALLRLAEQFKTDDNLKELISIMADQVQELEDALIDVRDLRSIATSFGQQLDNMGKHVGEPRNARNDADYRTAIILRVAINVSNGDPEILISIFKALASAIRVDYSEFYPAGFVMQSAGLVPVGQESQIASELKRAKSAGVAMELHQFDPADVFGFFDDPEALGFGDTGNPLTGGDFASVVI